LFQNDYEPLRPDFKRTANIYLHMKYQAAICLQIEFLSISNYEEIFHSKPKNRSSGMTAVIIIIIIIIIPPFGTTAPIWALAYLNETLRFT
jgi:hypothetical protein